MEKLIFPSLGSVYIGHGSEVKAPKTLKTPSWKQNYGKNFQDVSRKKTYSSIQQEDILLTPQMLDWYFTFRNNLLLSAYNLS